MLPDFKIIKAAVSLEDVVSRYCTFDAKPTKHGKMAVCPFHNDHNPSLEIRTTGDYADTFKCWSCGAYGDVIDFVEKYEHCSKFEAALWICENYAPHLLTEKGSARFKRYVNESRRTAANEKRDLQSAARELCVYLRKNDSEKQLADDVEQHIDEDTFSTEELCTFICQHGSPATVEKISERYHPSEEPEKKRGRPPKEQKEQICLSLLEEWLESHGISIRLNIISNAVSIIGLEDSGIEPELLVENVPVYLHDQLKFEFSGCSQNTVTGLLGLVASRHTFNPVLDFLAASPPWDGVDRLEDVYKALHIAENSTLLRTMVRKWFVQTISMQHNSIKHPFGGAGVLVLHGAQYTGKTTFLKKMFLHDPRDNFLDTTFHDGAGLFKEGIIIDRSKDSIIQGTTGWCCELGELCSTLKDQNEDFLKNFVTRAEDEFRVPYGKTYVTRPRRASFAGTVNDKEFLGDPTGTRRWWVIPISRPIDLDAIDALDKVQFWRQIQAYSDADRQSFRLEGREVEALNRSNSAFEKKIPAQTEVEDILNRAAEAPERYREIEITVSEFKMQYDVLRAYNVATLGRAIKKIYPNGAKHTSSGNKYLLPIPVGNHLVL